MRTFYNPAKLFGGLKSKPKPMPAPVTAAKVEPAEGTGVSDRRKRRGAQGVSLLSRPGFDVGGLQTGRKTLLGS